jgi:hypothetical protein
MVKPRKKQVSAKKRRSRKAQSVPPKSKKKASAKTVSRRGKPTRRPRKLAWKPTPEAQKVIDTTQDVFDNTPGAKSDCNKFVKAVCAALATDPFGAGDNADDITNDIRSDAWRGDAGWTGLKQDPSEAKKAADRGDLVIGGATGADLGQNHGHVVVVVSCEKLWKGYGYASWGKLRGTGKVNKKMTDAFTLDDLPSVSYMSKSI